MHFLFTINNTYAPHLAALICSLLDSQSEEKRLCFHVASLDLSQSSKEKLKSLTEIRDFSIAFYDIGTYNLDFSAFTIFSPHYFRVFAHEFIPKNIDTVIYLDVDTLVLRDLGELWNTPLDDNFVAAVTDPAVSGEHLKLAGFDSDKDTYFNSGVLLLNLKKMRNDNVTPLIYTIARRYGGIFLCYDQCLMNILFYKKRVKLPTTYNAILYVDTTMNPSIIHFCGARRPKPWGFYWNYKCNHPRAKLYWEYLRKTPWKDIKPPHSSNFKKWARLLLNKTQHCTHIFVSKPKKIIATTRRAMYFRRTLKKKLAQNKKNAYVGIQPGQTVYSYLSARFFNPGSFYFAEVTQCKFTGNASEADVTVMWGIATPPPPSHETLTL